MQHKVAAGGFTLLEIMIVIAIVGLLAVIAVPNFLKSRTYAQKQICIENLGQIESAKQIWGLENGKTEGESPTDSDLIGPDKYIKKTPVCPSVGTYDYMPLGRNATCSLGATFGHTL